MLAGWVDGVAVMRTCDNGDDLFGPAVLENLCGFGECAACVGHVVHLCC